MNAKTRKKLSEKAARRGLDVNERHVFFCGQSGCCDNTDEAKDAWKTLNKRLKQLEKQGVRIYRTGVECFSFCIGGPLLVVYPEGVWYGRVTAEVANRIIDEHLLGGDVVEEFVFARNPLKKL